jgi:hypothetical protein
MDSRLLKWTQGKSPIPVLNALSPHNYVIMPALLATIDSPISSECNSPASNSPSHYLSSGTSETPKTSNSNFLQQRSFSGSSNSLQVKFPNEIFYTTKRIQLVQPQNYNPQSPGYQMINYDGIQNHFSRNKSIMNMTSQQHSTVQLNSSNVSNDDFIESSDQNHCLQTNQQSRNTTRTQSYITDSFVNESVNGESSESNTQETSNLSSSNLMFIDLSSSSSRDVSMFQEDSKQR